MGLDPSDDTRRAPARRPGPSPLQRRSPPRRISAKSLRQIPQPTPSPLSRRRNPEATWHQALALQTADVQRCADKATGSLERLAVTVNIDSDGRDPAHVAGAADMPLSRCLDRALKDTPLAAPRSPVSFVHVFKLRTTPPRRP